MEKSVKKGKQDKGHFRPKAPEFWCQNVFSVFVKHTAFSIPREKLIIAVFQLFFAQGGKRRALYLSNWMNSTYNEFHCNSEYIYIKKKKNTENYSLMKQFAVKLQQIKGHDLGHESYGLIACHF